MCVCVQEEMGRAQIIILHGHQLAASHHYAMSLIVQRCNELRHHCDVITTAIRAKRAALTRSRDLLLRLEEVTHTHTLTHTHTRTLTQIQKSCVGRHCLEQFEPRAKLEVYLQD